MRHSRSRYLSLDAFRGYTVAAMIMVNFPGNGEHVFSTLRHSEWNGLTFTDQIAPYFLFIVGVSITLSMGSALADPAVAGTLPRKILLRALKIFGVGMFLNVLSLMPNFDFSQLRWTGTLHRISIVYLCCAMFFLRSGWRGQAFLAAILLGGYWAAMMLIPTPGEGVVMLEPGRNLAAWVDSRYLPGKMWQGSWDPEGILSTFPSIATGITGMLAGHVLRSEGEGAVKLNRLATAGTISAVLGYFIGLSFPVNENLWTSSFVLVTSGFATLVFVSMHHLSTTGKKAGWTVPGVVFGKNAIVAYVSADILAIFFYGLPIGGTTLNMHAFEALTALGLAPSLASLAYALFFVCMNFIPVWILFRRNIFIKL